MSKVTTLTPIIRGDTVKYRLKVKTRAGAPVDLTGDSISVTLKANIEDETPDLKETLEVPAGADAEDGIALVVLPHAKTKLLAPMSYHIDIQRAHAGEITTYVLTKVQVVADVNTDAE